jgi:transposase
VQSTGGDPLGLAEEPQHDVLGADVVVAQPPGFFLGQDDDVPGAVRESLKHGISVSRAALRSWYRTGQIPSRLVEGPHGPQRLVPLAVVADRAEASPRLRRAAERRLADQAQLEILRHRVDQLEIRLAALEQRQPKG